MNRRSAPRALRVGYAAAAAIVRPSMRAIARQEWTGLEHLPPGGAVFASNHISELDPLPIAHLLYNHGRTPTFLAKAELWDVPGLGSVLRALRQVPVQRRGDAGRSLEVAREVLDQDGAIIIYPEGTLTKDPDAWPMLGRSGAVRLALQTGAPLVPVGTWGTRDVLPPKARRLRLRPRRTVQIRLGAPVDLSDLRGRETEPAALREGTDRLMTAVTALVAELRGQTPPARPFDPRGTQVPAPDALDRAPRPGAGPDDAEGPAA